MSQAPVLQQTKKESAQVKALFLKNGQLQFKQPCTNICQILTPVICLIFTYLIKTLAEQNLTSGTFFQDNTFPYVFGDYTLLDANSKIIDSNFTPTANPARSNPLQWYLYDCPALSCDPTLLGSNDGSTPIAAPDGTTILGSIINAPPLSFVNNFTINYYKDQTLVPKNFPFFVPTAFGNVNTDLFNNISAVQKESFQFIKRGRSGLDGIPDGAVKFNTLSKTLLNATISINDVRDLDMHRNNDVTAIKQSKLLLSSQWVNGSRQVISAYGFLSLQHMISSAYTLILTGQQVKSGYVFTRETDTGKSFVDSIINTVAALIFPLSLSLLFPVMLYGLVLEKEQRLVQMMKMNGMKIRNYWLVYFIFNFILTIVTNLVFFLIGAFALNTNFFTKTSPLLMIIIAVGWALSQIGLAAFLQTFLSKARSANIIGYIISIWTMMIGSTLNIGVYQVPSQFPGWLQALPPFAFNRLFYLMLSNCSDADCYNSIGEISQEMKNCIAALYAGFVVFFLLGAYLLQVLPQQFGVRRHPLFPFIDFWNWITCKNNTTYVRPDRDRQLKKYLADDQQDPLSKQERETIGKMNQIDGSPLIINNLRKLYLKQGYKGPYAAVKSFNLKVAHKETFGLLGPNGAGKTTLINMLTGVITPDYGNAWVGGYDILTNVSKSQLQMGVCPQFDLLWPQLTVEEHLRFYARLKGTPGLVLEKKINEAIEEVNLTKFKNFLASSLSGGMKRRLSIAISLVGDPKIVFLDEPSSGLDPDNRRQIWQVLARCQQKRALFLTTHMMQEADALCHRIGIITRGTLRTLGNQLKLKKDYGQGYRMSLSLLSKQKKLVSPETLNLSGHNANMQNQPEVQAQLRRSISQLIQNEISGESYQTKKGIKKIADFIIKRFPGSALNRILGTSLIFKIPIHFKISQIFLEMHAVERQLEITNMAITDSSLEDVFIAVVLKYDKISDQIDEDQMRLKTITHELLDEDQQEEQPVIKPVIPVAPKKSPEQEKFGSIIQKSRDSVISQHEMKRRGSQE